MIYKTISGTASDGGNGVALSQFPKLSWNFINSLLKTGNLVNRQNVKLPFPGLK